MYRVSINNESVSNTSSIRFRFIIKTACKDNLFCRKMLLGSLKAV